MSEFYDAQRAVAQKASELINTVAASDLAQKATALIDRASRRELIAALQSRQAGLTAALHPILAAQHRVLVEDLRLDPAQVQTVVEGQLQVLDVLAARYDALDHAVHDSEIPFVELNSDGRIVYANDAFRAIVPHTNGSFASLFGTRMEHVEDALRSGRNQSLRVDVQGAGASRQVQLEIGPLRDAEGGPGHYALLLDQSAERSRLNALLDGVVRTDLTGHIRFANGRAAEILDHDAEALTRLDLRDVLLPETDGELDPTEDWLSKQSGFSGFVRLRLRDGRTVPARATGAPYVEGANQSAGLLVVFAPVVEDAARQELQRIIHEMRDPDAIIAATLQTIGTVISFDLATFGIYDETCSYWRALSVVPTPDFHWSTRWFPINEGQRDWLATGRTWDNDVSKWVDRYSPAERENSVTRAIIERGLNAMLVLPVHEVGGFRSAVVLLSKSHRYDSAELRTLQSLGVEEVLQAADAALERIRVRALAKLQDELNRAPSPRSLADTLSRRIVEIFGWEYAAVFRVDRVDQPDQGREPRFELMAEHATDSSLLVQGPGQGLFHQALGQGMLGACLQRKSVLVVDDVADPARNYGFIKTAEGQRSAMTVPLFVNGKVEMILDLEAMELNAFQGPDQEAARGLATICEQTFAARWHEVIERALMNRITQAAVIVDASGTIRQMNSAAEHLIGPARGDPLHLFGLTETHDQALLRQTGSELQKPVAINLSVSAGTGLPPAKVETIAERTPLFDDYGHQLWLFTNQAGQSRNSDWQFLEDTVTAVAQQTRAPLLIANGLLRGAASLARQPDLMDSCAQMLEQAANHLLKADLTFERLSDRLAVQQPPSDAPTRFDVRQVLFHELDALPETDQDDVTDDFGPNRTLIVTGWPERLGFAFRAAVGSLLLQRVTPADRLAIAIENDPPGRFTIRMSMAARSEQVLNSDAASPIHESQARAQHLARSSISSIAAAVKQHGGTLTERDGTVYEITLPLGTEDVGS